MYLCACSQVVYKNTNKLPVYNDSSLLARTDINHAKEASKLTSQVKHTQTKSCNTPSMHWVDGVISALQVKYKEGFDKLLKGQRPRYNPLECLSFKHTQAAAALASQVRDPVLLCPISPPIPPPKRLCGVAIATLRQIKKVVWMGAAEDEEHAQYQIRPILCSSLLRCDYSFIYLYPPTKKYTCTRPCTYACMRAPVAHTTTHCHGIT